MADDKPTVELRDFVNENKDLLTALGIFLAIAAFSANLSIKFVAIFISISAITCAAFIAIEIWRKPLKGKPSFLLSLFHVALFVLTFSLIVYCFYFFDAVYPDILFPIITLVLAGVEVWCVRKLSGWFNWVKRTVEWYKESKFWKFVIATTLVLGTLFLARYIANRIDVPAFEAVVWIAKFSASIKGPIQ